MKLIPIILRTFLLTFIFLNAAHAAETKIVGCLPLTTDDAKGFNPPRFEDYYVTEHFQGKPAEVDLKSNRQAKRYRTMLQTGSKEGPDFAGHYTIVGWGCGSSCLQFAIVNSGNGQVFFPPKIKYISTVHVADSKEDLPTPKYNALRYHQDSSLLIIIGAPNEEEASEGIAYYQWTGKILKLLKFIPSRKKSCDDELQNDIK